MNIKAKITTWFVLTFLPLLAKAQQSPLVPNNPAPGALPGQGGESIGDLIEAFIVDIFLPITGLIAVLFIIIGGFRYITSAGNDEAAESGKKTLINAVIGLVVVILSYIIVTVVANALTP